MYKNGVLPRAGGWLDQTNKFNQVMVFIDATIRKHNIESQKNGRK